MPGDLTNHAKRRDVAPTRSCRHGEADPSRSAGRARCPRFSPLPHVNGLVPKIVKIGEFADFRACSTPSYQVLTPNQNRRTPIFGETIFGKKVRNCPQIQLTSSLKACRRREPRPPSKPVL